MQYQQGCNSGKKFWVTYTDQVVVNGSGFSAGGDSGSLIVTSTAAQPVALLFAGSSTQTIGNRIDQVLSALSTQLRSTVSFVGGGSNAGIVCPSGGGPKPHTHGAASAVGVQRAIEAKDRHANQLMADPAVLGVGVGADEQTARP